MIISVFSEILPLYATDSETFTQKVYIFCILCVMIRECDILVLILCLVFAHIVIQISINVHTLILV